MKNNRIRDAYDSINPSPVDKQRMLDAILAEAKLEEVPRKTVRKRQPIVYTSKQSATPKRSGLFGTLAAMIALVIVAGFALRFLSRQPEDITATSPVEPVPAGTPYSAVLTKYKTALEQGWTKYQCQIEGISTRMQAGNDVTMAGYALLDLDRDGREELIIAEESTDRTDNIWDLYTTLEDGTPIQLWVDEQDGGQCRLYEGNVISISYSNKHELDMTFYVLESGKFVMREMLQWEDEDTVFHTDTSGNTRQVTSREGQDITNAYDGQKLELTWLAEMFDSIRNTDAIEVYTPVLEKYRTALDQGWDRTMCVENGISSLTPIENEYEGLYYAVSDLDGNGTEELVISQYPYRENTDTDFIDIYTVLDGHVIQLMSLGDMDMRYLCEGGYVKDLSSPNMEKYIHYVSFWGIVEDQFMQDSAVYQKSDGQWITEGYRKVGAAISREEAEAIIADYSPLQLDFIRIGVRTQAETVTGYEGYDHIVNKYVTAIQENWTDEQCEQNDISPDIFSMTTISHNLGWCLRDIDENGVEELIISDGVHLFDLYVMMPHNGGPGHLIMANGGQSYQLCEDGTIEQFIGFSKGMSRTYFELSGIDLVQRNMLYYTNSDPANPYVAINQYSYGTGADDLEVITKEEAGRIIGSHRTAELTLNLFLNRGTFNPDDLQYYQQLLELYQTALNEDWHPATCQEKGMSLMVAYRGEYYDDLGYTMMDLDHNGIDELIITDGTNIYDLYTIVQDEVIAPVNILSAMERIKYYLTEDNVIYHFGSSSASANYQTFSRLEGSNLVLIEGYFYDGKTNPDQPWYFYDYKNNNVPCVGLDVQEIIDSYKIVEIPFIPFR